MRRKATIKKPLYFRSGRIALEEGGRVHYEFYNETVWVYSIPRKTGTEQLLYTFNSRSEARKYLKPT